MRSIAWLSLALYLTIPSLGQQPAELRNDGSISIPTLVESKAGQIAYGLSAEDFSLKDNGVPQRLQLESEPTRRPLSLLLVIQTGHNAESHLQDISGLDDLLDSILTSPSDQVGVITFDSRPSLVQQLTSGSKAISSALGEIRPGDSGSALFDAIHMAINSLRSAPAGNRKAILLISSEHDHGSNASDTASLVRDSAASNASIDCLSFVTGRQGMSKLRSLNPLAMTAAAMQKNSPSTLAQLTGGDFYRFNSERQFEDEFGDIATHLNNRYILAFRPSKPEPGFHSLQVQVLRAKINVVSSRSGYWVSSSDPTAGAGGEE
jgi:VWFA-related protein